MSSIASACRVCLVGILALSAWTEGKELISTSVTDGASLGAALKQENVGVIKVKGKHLLYCGASLRSITSLWVIVMRHVVSTVPLFLCNERHVHWM